MHLVGNDKSSTFAPAIERDAVQIEILKTEMRIWTSASKKNFLKKLRKVLVVQKKSLPLHPLSKRKQLKKSSLKDLDMNKQVVQDYLF